jgi:hypothetical protein
MVQSILALPHPPTVADPRFFAERAPPSLLTPLQRTRAHATALTRTLAPGWQGASLTKVGASTRKMEALPRSLTPGRSHGGRLRPPSVPPVQGVLTLFLT